MKLAANASKVLRNLEGITKISEHKSSKFCDTYKKSIRPTLVTLIAALKQGPAIAAKLEIGIQFIDSVCDVKPTRSRKKRRQRI